MSSKIILVFDTETLTSDKNIFNHRKYFCYFVHLCSENYWFLIIEWKRIYYFGGKEGINVGQQRKNVEVSENKTMSIVYKDLVRTHSQSLQFCLTLCDLMDWSPQGSSFHGIFPAKILEWIVRPSSRGSSRPRDQTHIS